jgi:hypothetical protein
LQNVLGTSTCLPVPFPSVAGEISPLALKAWKRPARPKDFSATLSVHHGSPELFNLCLQAVREFARADPIWTIQPNRDGASVIETKLSIHDVPARNAPGSARILPFMQLPSDWAISYVWGEGRDLDKTKHIMLDGCRFPVTANVHAALHEYRTQASMSLKIWIDATCIDQENKGEKDGQITLMREVYTLA